MANLPGLFRCHFVFSLKLNNQTSKKNFMFCLGAIQKDICCEIISWNCGLDFFNNTNAYNADKTESVMEYSGHFNGLGGREVAAFTNASSEFPWHAACYVECSGWVCRVCVGKKPERAAGSFLKVNCGKKKCTIHSHFRLSGVFFSGFSA